MCISRACKAASNVSLITYCWTLFAFLVDQQYSRVHYAEEMQMKLETVEGDKRLFEALKISLARIQERLEEGRVAAQLLEVSLINAACDDPSASIAEKLVLPLIQESLEQGAWQFAEEKAKQAQEEIMALLEVSCEGNGSYWWVAMEVDLPADLDVQFIGVGDSVTPMRMGSGAYLHGFNFYQMGDCR